MNQEFAVVERERFDLTDSSCYLLQGTLPKDCRVRAVLDQETLEAEVSDWSAFSALERFQNLDSARNGKVTVRVRLPEHPERRKKLSVFYSSEQEEHLWFSVRTKELLKKQHALQFFIEEVQRDAAADTCSVRGWVASRLPVEITAENSRGEALKGEVLRQKRPDVIGNFPECEIQEMCGFYASFSRVGASGLQLVFTEQETGKVQRQTVSMKKHAETQEKLLRYWKNRNRYLKTYGVSTLAKKVWKKVTKQEKTAPLYSDWLPKHLPSQAELERQKKEQFAFQPKISIVVPLYRTPERYLLRMAASVQEQTYGNWELCLSDGSGADSPIADTLERLSARDSRIRVVSHPQPLQISENTNAAIALAEGDFIAFMDHDDELLPHALYECVKLLNQNRELLVLYSDEDKMSMDGHKFFQPHMKPDFNIDLLCTVNYICHLMVVKRTLIDEIGVLRPEFDGAQDYDFTLRCVEAAGRARVGHIPKILYHWRSHEDSTAENPESKLYAFDAGQRAVQAHFDRIGVPARVKKGEFLGLYRTEYLWPDQPLVSVLIPNKDHTEDLERCISSIERLSRYPNLEYIIIENNSEKEETFAYYRKLEAEHPRARVITWEQGFNYSAINNFGAAHAKGEYFLLLNNDTELINPDCIEELLGYCRRPDVGAVGARLYYEDDTIQHAGVVVGFGGIAGHCFVQQPRGFTGYCHRIICAQDYSAVTAACMMVKRSAFEAVGGLTEELAVAFNDIDFCLKLGRAGYLVVYNPYAELYHYESKSRGLEDTPEKVARFNGEIATFEKHWPEILRDGDPFYNPNLTLDSQDFSLRRI